MASTTGTIIDQDTPVIPKERSGHIGSRLYRGETAFDFVGRKKIWFVISSLVILAGLGSFAYRGLNFSIDFKGGVSWQVNEKGLTVPKATSVIRKTGLVNPTITILGGKTLNVDAKVSGNEAKRYKVENTVADALAKASHTSASNVSVSYVGPTWGGDISSKAIEALIFFFLAIAAYISIRFEWRMAVAALIAVVHDLLVTVGVYAIGNFQVTPDTVIAVLTILGYSLYDTVVVFDRVEENVRGIGQTGRLTYSNTVNLSMNQVMMRSINTSLVAILPILSVLVLGADILGATTLQYFGLALFIGLTSGAYSSIFIASPLLAMLKEREPRYIAIRKRIEAKGDEGQHLTPGQVARMAIENARKSRTNIARAQQSRKNTSKSSRQGTQKPKVLTPEAARPKASEPTGQSVSELQDSKASDVFQVEKVDNVEDIDPSSAVGALESESSDNDRESGSAEPKRRQQPQPAQQPRPSQQLTQKRIQAKRSKRKH